MDSKQAKKSQLSMNIWPIHPIKYSQQSLKRQDKVSLALFSSTHQRVTLKQSSPT